jgi:hypothetical protein
VIDNPNGLLSFIVITLTISVGAVNIVKYTLLY